MDEHVGRRRSSAAPSVVAGGARAERLPHRPLLAGDGARRRAGRRPRRPPRRRSARSRRSSAIGSVDEAIELTNASPYGLLAAIFTGDLSAGLRFADAVRTGWVNINESTNYWESHLPFGGRAGTDSGIGRVGGAHSMEAFTELQTVTMRL